MTTVQKLNTAQDEAYRAELDFGTKDPRFKKLDRVVKRLRKQHRERFDNMTKAEREAYQLARYGEVIG